MASRYRASYRGIGQMLCAPWMQREMVRRARNVKSRAMVTAPVDTGDYKDSFRIRSGIRDRPTRRAVARITNYSGHALYVEYGTSDTPRFATLRNALTAAGD